MAKIGFLALAARWFWDTKMGDPEFSSEAESRIKNIEAALGESHDIVSAGLVSTEEAASSAVARFKEANVDVLVACCFMWSEDQPLFRVIEELQITPLLLWCWTPGNALPRSLSALDLIKWSGPVGAQQISGALRRSGRRFTLVMGNHTEEETLREIRDFATASMAARRLKHARIGFLPYRYYVMTNTWVDEFDVMTKFGVDVIHISVNQLLFSASAVKDAEVKSYIDALRHMRTLPEVTSQGLSEAAKVSLGLAKLVDELGLDAVSIGDCNDELHSLLKCRPCLYLPSVFERGTVVGMEGDLLGVIAQLTLSELSGQPTMFTEIFTYDEMENQILVGHAGMHDIRLAQNRSAVTLTPDYEYPNEKAGVWMAFSVRPGPITLLSITSTQSGFHFVATKGEALPVQDKLQGYPHALVKLDIPLKSFFQATTDIGTTQHWALVPGDLRGAISKVASILGLDCTILSAVQES